MSPTIISPSIIQHIGGTPLVRLNKVPQSLGVKATVLAKLEYLNPGGSVKDRIAKCMVEQAERDGHIKPGDTLIEASSGNTGIAIAMVAAVKGYDCIITLSEKMSFEKERVLRALGARVVRTPAGVPVDSPHSIISVARRLQRETPNAWILDQYNNPANPAAHETAHAEEIWRQTGGRVDAVIAGAGTGGTVTGLARGLRKKEKEEGGHGILIVGVDPVGSVLAVPPGLNEVRAEYKVEGTGYDFVPSVLDQDVPDLWVKTEDGESFRLARRLAREEGLLCGGSSGAAVAALSRLLSLRPELNEEAKVIVLIFPDGLRNYLTKFADDKWMEENGFSQESDNQDEKRSQLIRHFKGRSLDSHSTGWSELWDSGRSDFWDRGFPSPALIDLIAQRPDMFDPLSGDDSSRRKALVPGCGRGYDPVMLALHGFDAYGLEVSASAIKAAEDYAVDQLAIPSGYNFHSGGEARAITHGEVAFIQGDYFSREWEQQLDWSNAQFDIIYDYTFLCALPPELRRVWADRAAQLLRSGGLLVCLEYPLWKDLHEDGPPWGLEGVYWNLLALGGDGIHLNDAHTHDTESVFERIAYVKPERSYNQGRGRDMISVWKRK